MKIYATCLLLIWAETAQPSPTTAAPRYDLVTQNPQWNWMTPNPQWNWMTPTQTACNYAQYRCGDGRCIPQSYVCDGGRPDCSDGSDERNCYGSRGRMRPTPRYDWATQNPQWNWMTPTQTACNYAQYRCGDGRCIPQSYVCDGGRPDCSDGSDERNCDGSRGRMRPTSRYDWATQNPRRHWMRPGYDWTTPSPRRYWMRPTSRYDWATQNPRRHWMRPRYDWTTPSPRRYWMRPTQPSYTDADVPNPLIRVYRLEDSAEDEVIVSCRHRITVRQNRLQLNVMMDKRSFTLQDPDFSSRTERLFKIVVSSPAVFTCVEKLPGRTFVSDMFTFSKRTDTYGTQMSSSYVAFAGFLGFMLIFMISVVIMATLWKIHIEKKRNNLTFRVSEAKTL